MNFKCLRFANFRRYGTKIEKRSPSSGQINILGGLDLRSDTLTLPCLKMREILAKSPCGDDVYGQGSTKKSVQILRPIKSSEVKLSVDPLIWRRY